LGAQSLLLMSVARHSLTAKLQWRPPRTGSQPDPLTWW
jgi:hypothetical protein